MTVIVALKDKKNKNIVVGSDTLWSTPHTKGYHEKIFKLKIPIDTGDEECEMYKYLTCLVCGSHFLMSYMMNAFTVPCMCADEDFVDYYYNKFSVALKDFVVNNNFVRLHDNVADGDVGFIFVFDNRIYNVYDDFSMVEEFDDYCVMGHGQLVAIGSLLGNLRFREDMSCRDMVFEAVSVSVESDCFCGGDVDVRII